MLFIVYLVFLRKNPDKNKIMKIRVDEKNQLFPYGDITNYLWFDLLVSLLNRIDHSSFSGI